jgi:hypothetical protein
MKGDKVGIPWQWLCNWNQLDSERGFYRWLYEPDLQLYVALWKDRNIVPLISTGYGVSPTTVQRGGGGKKKTKTLRPTDVPFGRYNYRAPKLSVPYNKFMGGTDLFDKLRLLSHYSMERHIVCHKWWQKYFWGLMDCALSNAYICWKSVAPSKRSHQRFFELLHDGLVNNTFDTTGTWGLINPKVRIHVSKTPLKVLDPPKTPSTPLRQLSVAEKYAAAAFSPSDTEGHGLVLWGATSEYKHVVKHRGRKGTSQARKRCAQCKLEGRPDVFTSWVCPPCNNVFLCDRKRNCYQHWHQRLNRNVKDCTKNT